MRWIRTLACRAYWRALEGRPGVVHLNFALREPLVLDADELPEDPTGRPHGAPFVRRVTASPSDPAAIEALGALLRDAERGVLVAGRHERPTPLGKTAATFCAAAGWPLLADPLSGARRGTAAIAHYDALLRDAGFAAAQRPDLVLRVGDLPTSKPLRQWLAGLDSQVPQIQLDPEGAWQDPAGVLTHSFALDPAEALIGLAGSAGGATAQAAGGQTAAPTDANPISADPDWLATWRSADQRAAEAILGVLAGDGLSEPALAAELGVLLPAEATLFVASSMPVRDIETFWPVRGDPPRVLCNRGANGIDGTVSSAFGVAAWAHAAQAGAARGNAGDGGGGGPVVLLIGDVALAHDIGGLLAARRLDLSLTIVLVDNRGGGIFDFLPVSAAPMARSPAADDAVASKNDADIGAAPPATAGPSGHDLYTRHITTPTGLDFARAAALYGIQHDRVSDLAGLRDALEQALDPGGPRTRIIELRGERDANVALHRRVWAAVGGALDRH